MFDQFPEIGQTHPRASERIQTGPNGSEQVRTRPKTSNNLEILELIPTWNKLQKQQTNRKSAEQLRVNLPPKKRKKS